MHLLYYGRDVLDVHALSEPVSVAILVGAGYGILRAIVDFLNVASGIGRRR